MNLEETRLLSLNRELNSIDFIMAAQNFWAWAPNFVKTEDEENKVIRHYPTHHKFPYLLNFTNQIDNNQLIVVVKSRRLLITWTVILKFMHWAQFAGTKIPGSHQTFRAAILSIDEEVVKDSFRHLFGVYDRFPDALKEFNPIVKKNALEIEFAKGGSIKGFSLKQEGPHGYGFSAMLFDEMSRQAFARSTWTGAMPTLGKDGKMIAVSTPNGRDNFFYELFVDPYNQYSGINRMKIHWYANPEHDQEWYQNVTSKLPELAVRSQYLLDFTAGEGDAVYGGYFEPKAHITDEPPEYLENKPVLQWWDMGFHNPACGFGQINGQDQLVVYYSEKGHDEDIYDFGNRIREVRASFFPPNMRYIHFVPPDAWKRYSIGESRHGHRNDFDALFSRRNGVFAGEQAFRGAVETSKRISSVRSLLRLRDDGRAGLVIYRPYCKNLIEGFEGGYIYPPRDRASENKSKLETPIDNSWAHEQDALQMVATGYKEFRAKPKKKMQRTDTRDFMSKGMSWKIGT